MNWALEIAATGDEGRQKPACAWFDLDGLRLLLSLAGVAHVDAYSAAEAPARDPFVATAAGPLVFAIAYFQSGASLRSAIEGHEFRRWLDTAPDGLALTATPLRAIAFPVDEPMAGARVTRYHYVVRYRGPQEEAARFAAQYERTHPPLLARLPRIRAISCFRPIAGLVSPHCAHADYLIGNEVEFDSAEDFNSAMASPARAALRADFDALPRVFCDNTHYAMRRERRHPPPLVAAVSESRSTEQRTM